MKICVRENSSVEVTPLLPPLTDFVPLLKAYPIRHVNLSSDRDSPERDDQLRINPGIV